MVKVRNVREGVGKELTSRSTRFSASTCIIV